MGCISLERNVSKNTRPLDSMDLSMRKKQILVEYALRN